MWYNLFTLSWKCQRPGVRVADSCETCDMGARKWHQVPWKNIMCSNPLGPKEYVSVLSRVCMLFSLPLKLLIHKFNIKKELMKDPEWQDWPFLIIHGFGFIILVPLCLPLVSLLPRKLLSLYVHPRVTTSKRNHLEQNATIKSMAITSTVQLFYI